MEQAATPPLAESARRRELERLLQAATAEGSTRPSQSFSSSSSSSSATLLPALHSALLHATTHVPAVLDVLEQEVAFLSSPHAKGAASSSSKSKTTARFGRDIIDANFLDAEIQRRKEKLRELREAKSARNVIVGATVQSHVIQRALASQDRAALAVTPVPSPKVVLASIAAAKGSSLVDEDKQVGTAFGGGAGKGKKRRAPLGQRDENADRSLARQIIEGDMTSDEAEHAIPLTQIPVSSLLETRDELALELLRLRAKLEKLSQRRDLVRLGNAEKGFEGLDALGRSVASLLKAARDARPPPLPSGSGLPSTLTSSLGSSSNDRQAATDADTSGAERNGDTKGDKDEQEDGRIRLARRVDKARRMLREMRAKREMVKGVLRGIILESTLDWASDPKLSKLMLRDLRDLSEAESESEEDEEKDDEEVEEEEEGGENWRRAKARGRRGEGA